MEAATVYNQTNYQGTAKEVDGEPRAVNPSLLRAQNFQRKVTEEELRTKMTPMKKNQKSDVYMPLLAISPIFI